MPNCVKYFENSIMNSTTGYSPEKPYLIPRGRGQDPTNDVPVSDTTNDCICFREKSGSVLCRACGHLMSGRKRLSCTKHPRIVFLMDLTGCGKCKAYAFMLKEINAQVDYQRRKFKGTRLQFGSSSKIAANFDLNNNN